MTLEWARSVASDAVFEERVFEAPLDDLVDLEEDLIEHFRGLKRQGSTPPGARLPIYPGEIYLILFRANVVMRAILEKRESVDEAMITPEINRRVQRIEEELKTLA